MNDAELLQETYRLAKDNNRMLHAMRRNSFLSMLFWIIFYVALFVVAPLWLYSSYLQPVIQQVQRLQGQTAQTQSQFSSFEQAWKQLQSELAPLRPSTSTSQ